MTGQTELIAALIGAMTGALEAFTLEFVIRPLVTRRWVAAILRIEIQSNRQSLLAFEEFQQLHPDALPSDIHFDTVAFENLAAFEGRARLPQWITLLPGRLDI